MSRFEWGIINFLTPDWRTSPEKASDFVVSDYRNGPSDLRAGLELLALAGDTDAAGWIGDLIEDAYGRDVAVLTDVETDKLIDVLDTIPAAVRATLVDHQDRVQVERIQELKSRSSALDFTDALGHQPEDAVAEAISRVYSVRQALVDARRRGLDVALN